MCLAIPGKIIRITEADEKNPRMATVDFGGIIRTIRIEWVDTQNGDYILAHAGVALTVVNRDDAEAALDDFRKLSTFNTRHHE